MASPPEQPWSNHERNYLLAEIIKAANLPPDVLLNVIRSLRIEPRWEDTSLPYGRSLNASRFAYDTMQRSLPVQPMSITMGPQTPMTIPASTLKRPFAPTDAPYSVAGREIRPKPLMGGPGYAQPSPSEPTPKRKRGRPTKAEQQAKAEAAAAAAAAGISFEAGPPGQIPPRSSSLMPGAMQSLGPSPMPEEAKPMLPPTTRMPIAAMLTPTTREPKSASNSSSSSGRRRRGRSTKSEPEGTPTARSRSDYDSPHEMRAGPVPEDSPARTAILRHREEMAEPAERPSPNPGQQQHPQQPPSQPPQPPPYRHQQHHHQQHRPPPPPRQQ